MAIRVTETQIEEIYEKQNEDLVLLPFIIIASQLVDKIEAYITSRSQTPDNNNLFEIERWLTAHFITTREKVTRSEGVGSVSESYDLSTKVGLANSHYGQTAILLDTSGYLKKLDDGTISNAITPSIINL